MKQNKEKKSHIVLFSAAAMLVAMIVVGLTVLLLSSYNRAEDNPMTLDNSDCINLLDRLTYRDTGERVRFDRMQTSALAILDEDGTAEINTFLSTDTPETYSLFFRADCLDVRIYCNDQLLYDSRTEIEPTATPDMFRVYCVNLPALQAGTELNVKFTATNTDRICIQFPCCGTTNAIQLHIFHECMEPFIIAVFAFLMMIVGIIVFFNQLSRGTTHPELLLVALFSALSVFWMISDSGLGVLFFGYNVVLYFVNYSIPILLIVTYLLLLQIAAGKRLPGFTHIALSVLVLLLVTILLHKLRVVTLRSMMLPFCFAMFAIYLYSALLILSRLKKDALVLKIVSVVMALVMAASFIIFLINKKMQGTIFFRYALLIFVVVMLVVLIRHINQLEFEARQSAQLKREKEDAETRMLVSQINSHFFYNTINTIRGLILSNADEAYKMTGDFGKYIRYRVNSAGTERRFTSFRDELRAIRAYADIYAIQMNQNLKMNYEIEADDFMIPTLTVEPFVENAIHHGIYHEKGEGTVTVKAERAGQLWKVTVTDNGCGFDPSILENTKRVGIYNIRKRLAQYPGCSLSIKSKKGVGTTVTIIYPDSFGGAEYESNPC